jgi:hypothetical protein
MYVVSSRCVRRIVCRVSSLLGFAVDLSVVSPFS